MTIFRGIEISKDYYDSLFEKQKQGGCIQIIDDYPYCLMPYENVENGEIIGSTDNLEYQAKVAKEENKKKIYDLQTQINELDFKRIRAICELSVKDAETGETWLEYYNLQVQELRTQINALG